MSNLIFLLVLDKNDNAPKLSGEPYNFTVKETEVRRSSEASGLNIVEVGWRASVRLDGWGGEVVVERDGGGGRGGGRE